MLAKVTEGPINTSPKCISLKSVDVCVGGYRSKKTKKGFVFEVRSVIVEHIERQHEKLIQIGQYLMVRDYIKLDTYFGHHHDGEWLDIPLVGKFRVKDIIPEEQNDQIRLMINPHRFQVFHNLIIKDG